MAKKEAARKTDEATVQSILPDVCLTPIGSALVPVPYQITSKLNLSVRTVKTVAMKGLQTFTMSSRTTKVVGDEPGVGGGILSGVNLGYCRPTTHTNSVRAGGSYVVRHSSLFHMNCDGPDGTPNTVGKLVYLKIKNVSYSQPVSLADVKSAVDMLGRADRPGWWSKVSSEFEKKVRAMAKRLGVDPDDIMATMSYETGGLFDGTTPNTAGSGALGLIQFMPSTAEELLGTETTKEALEALAAMTDEQQLAVVEQHLSKYASKASNLDDLYMTIFWPKAAGKPDSYVLFEKNGKYAKLYKGHASLDANGDGKITKKEAAAKVRKQREQQRKATEEAKKRAAAAGNGKDGVKITK